MDIHPHMDWKGRQVVVMGFARSGQAVSRLLARHGAVVTATDRRDAHDLGVDPAAFAAEGIQLVLGEHPDRLLEGAPVLVVSPGIPKTAPFLLNAEKAGVTRLGELDVASRFSRAPLIAVTGTNGKSTTVHLLGALVAACGRPTVVAGNVGLAFSEVVEDLDENGVFVVEVSSYQLEDVEEFHPRGAAILNVTPDHLDRYRSLDHYRETKERIFDRQDATDIAVLPADPRWDDLASGLSAKVFRFGPGAAAGARETDRALIWCDEAGEDEILSWSEFPLAGDHNRANAAAAVALLPGVGIDPKDPRVGDALSRATPLRHRLEPVGTIGGVTFFNDSKATNPESLEVALASFEKPVVLIAGGLAKPADYGRLGPLVAAKSQSVVLIGDAAEALESSWSGTGIPMIRAGGDFAAAVAQAFQRARAGGADVLLSPGCASFDMFPDYEARGDRFREIVADLGANP